jgi:hypothetical protein
VVELLDGVGVIVTAAIVSAAVVSATVVAAAVVSAAGAAAATVVIGGSAVSAGVVLTVEAGGVDGDGCVVQNHRHCGVNVSRANLAQAVVLQNLLRIIQEVLCGLAVAEEVHQELDEIVCECHWNVP